MLRLLLTLAACLLLLASTAAQALPPRGRAPGGRPQRQPGCGPRGCMLARAAYAVYNGGPDAVARPWDSTSPWHQNDVNFWDSYHNKRWASSS